MKNIRIQPAEVEAYQAPDGQLFEDFRKAERHCHDLVGETLDELMAVATTKPNMGSITRVDQHRVLMHWLESADEIRPIISRLNAYLQATRGGDQ